MLEAYAPPTYPESALSTSPGCTPCFKAFAASTSTRYCGYFVSNDVDARAISGRLFSSAITLFVTCLRSSIEPPFWSCTWISKPLLTPYPGIIPRVKTISRAPVISAVLRYISSMTEFISSPSWVRSLQSFIRMLNIPLDEPMPLIIPIPAVFE